MHLSENLGMRLSHGETGSRICICVCVFVFVFVLVLVCTCICICVVFAFAFLLPEMHLSKDIAQGETGSRRE